MSIIGVLAILGMLTALWFRIKSFFIDKKVQNDRAKVEAAKEQANQKVGTAASAADDFEQRLRDYRDKKTDSTGDSSS